jgi:hypothetical protein
MQSTDNQTDVNCEDISNLKVELDAVCTSPYLRTRDVIRRELPFAIIVEIAVSAVRTLAPIASLRFR